MRSDDSPRSKLGLIIESTKPGITRMVTLSAVVGFIVSASYHGLYLSSLILPILVCVLGTAIAASGANAMNQWVERSRDAVMKRTRNRPLPSGGLTPGTVLAYSVALSIAGPVLLLAFGYWVAAAITFLTVVLYVVLYTPMKWMSPKSTVVGAVPGALPILIGWTVASPSGLADLAAWPAWSLFLLLFAWQMPHFLAIAVMYRDDYARAGYRTLLQTARSDSAVLTAIVLWSLVMVAASIAPLVAMPNLFGLGYGLTAVVMGVWMVLLVGKLGKTLAAGGARTLFFASIVYLPVVFIALVVDACIGTGQSVS
ncbi:MAG: heme o synthase [Phycisphaerales bacterium]